MSASPNLQLPYLDANQNQKTVTHNQALRMLDALVNLRVASATLQAPPASLADGQRWIVAPGGTGPWAGRDLTVAAWQDGAWTFYAPNPGFTAYVDALQSALVWNGSAWGPLVGGITQLSLMGLGIGTGVDAANPLSVQANAALFAALPGTANPAGTGDMRLKLSKQASGNAASLLFQDAFSGRAEIGLVGDDNFHFKVSPDGVTFADALVLAAAGGGATFIAAPNHPTPAPGDASTRSATTAFVAAGFVTYTYAGATYATAANATLTGTPTAPTAAAGNNSTRLATTAYADRAAAAGILSRAQVSDAAYAVQPSDRVVAVVALTAGRTLTLPAAAAYPQGATLTVFDESGNCSATRSLTLQVAAPAAGQAADAINGAASAVLSMPYAYLALQGNGANKWTVVDAGSYALTPLKPAFDLYGVNTQAAYPCELTWMNRALDRNGNVDMTTGRFTAPVAGFYFLTLSVLCNANSAGTEVVSIRKNGASLSGRQTYDSSTGVSYIQITTSTVIQLAAGDYVSAFTQTSVYSSAEGLATFCGFLVA